MVTKRQKEAYIEYKRQGTLEKAGDELGISPEAVYEYKKEVEEDMEYISDIASEGFCDDIKKKILK